MDPDVIAPMVVMITGFVVTGGVLVLRPLTKRLGDLIQIMIEDRRREAKPMKAAPDTERMVEVLESIETRLSRLEERQTFTDAMLSGGPLERTPVPPLPPRRTAE